MSHPYAGNPASFVPAITLGDDGVDVPSFVNFNTGYEGLADRTAYLYQAGLGAALRNWGDPVSPTSAWLGVAYDAKNQRWVTVDGSGGTAKFGFSVDGGKHWTLESTSFFVDSPVGIACDAAGITYFAFANASSQIIIFAAPDPTGGIPTTVSATATVGAVFYDVTAGKAFCIAGNQTGGTFTAIARSIQYVASSAPTVATLTLPSGWASGTNHIGTYLTSQPAFGVATIVAMGGATPGTDTARLMSVAGTVLTDITFSALASKIIVGVGFQAATTTWSVAAYDGTNTTFYTSLDLATWTAQSIIPGKSNGLGALGTLWLTTSVDPSSGFFRPFVSADGGATWKGGAFNFGSTTPVSVSMAPNQALIWNDGLLAHSDVYGVL